MSAIGVVLLLAALLYGRSVSESPELAHYFTLSGPTLALLIIGYGFVASVLPVWLLLAPRDYLSTFLKVGTVALLAVGIVIVHPDLEMPAVTKFIDGTGPVWAGSLFPFLFSYFPPCALPSEVPSVARDETSSGSKCDRSSTSRQDVKSCGCPAATATIT